MQNNQVIATDDLAHFAPCSLIVSFEKWGCEETYLYEPLFAFGCTTHHKIMYS